MDPLIAILVKDGKMIDAVPVFDAKSLAQVDAVAKEKPDHTLLKVHVAKIINAATASPLVLAAKGAVSAWNEQEGRLKEATGDSIRFQMVQEAIDKLKAALP